MCYSSLLPQNNTMKPSMDPGITKTNKNLIDNFNFSVEVFDRYTDKAPIRKRITDTRSNTVTMSPEFHREYDKIIKVIPF